MTNYIFGYGLGWYPKKFLYLFIHIIIGAIVSLPVWFFVNDLSIYARIALFLNSLIIGSCIEWTQNDYAGKEWADSKIWFLGSVRDVIFYAGASWIVFL